MTTFRAAKLGHTLSFGVGKGALRANLEALQACLEKDETEGSSRVVITLSRDAVGSEYAAEGVIAVARADCSIADALHAGDGSPASLELPLTLVDGPKKGQVMGVVKVTVGFQNVGLAVVEGKGVVGAATKEDNEAIVIWGETLDIGGRGSAQDRGLRQADAIAVLAEGAGKCRSMLTKDDAGQRLPRSKLVVNHKWVFAGEALEKAMGSGKIRLAVVDVSAKREDELGDAEVGLIPCHCAMTKLACLYVCIFIARERAVGQRHQVARHVARVSDAAGSARMLSRLALSADDCAYFFQVDLGELSSRGRREHAVTVTLQSSKNKLATLQLHIALPQSTSDKVGAEASISAGKDVVTLTIEAFSIEESSHILKDKKFRRLMASIQWFGEVRRRYQLSGDARRLHVRPPLMSPPSLGNRAGEMRLGKS